MRLSRGRLGGVPGVRALWRWLADAVTWGAKPKGDGPAPERDYRAYVGPANQYDFMGATQFRLLATLGLREKHYLLDIGCGSLRAGRLLIPYLLPDRYYGIEPNKFLIDEAIANEIGADLIKLKRPSFKHNADFDYGVFGRKFDYIVAQSIFSHTGAELALQGLSRLPEAMHPNTIALVTFKPADPGAPRSEQTGWVYPGTVPFDEAEIATLIRKAGLFGVKLPWFHPRQAWYFLSTRRRNLPSKAELECLSGTVLRDARFSEAASHAVRQEATREVSVENVPFPPATVFFHGRNRDPEDALRQGVANVELARASGANVEDGLVLDIGCGYGRFAYGLLKSGFKGRYVGIDVVEPLTTWLRENFTAAQPSYSFHFDDVQNDLYNPDGKRQLSFRTILAGDMPAAIVLFSVFSHMYGEDIEAHLTKIAEVMSPQSRLLFSCFLFDGVAEEGQRSGSSDRKFGHELSPNCRAEDPDAPLQAIAYTESFVRQAMERAGLIGEITRGGWSGKKMPASLPWSRLPGWPGYQDWVVARKA